MSVNITQVLSTLDLLRNQLADMFPPPESPSPFVPVGKVAPAYDKCRGLWEAGQRAGVFSIHAYTGGGIRPGAAQLAEPAQVDQQVIENAIVALGMSPWGKDWLSDDSNAAMIDWEYCRKFVGYHVVRIDQNDEAKGYRRVV